MTEQELDRLQGRAVQLRKGEALALIAEVRRLQFERDKLRKKLACAIHQLATLHGLYASDHEDFSYPFQIELSEVLKALEAQ